MLQLKTTPAKPGKSMTLNLKSQSNLRYTAHAADQASSSLQSKQDELSQKHLRNVSSPATAAQLSFAIILGVVGLILLVTDYHALR